jgi:predicted nucleic acid-binding protein
LIVVDTAVWIDFFRETRTPHTQRLLGLIEDEAPVALTQSILYELLCGVDGHADPGSGEAGAWEDALRHFPVLRHRDADYAFAAALFRTARDSGRTVRAVFDCLIAATCIRTESLLLHSDADFDRLAACTPLRIFPLA